MPEDAGDHGLPTPEHSRLARQVVLEGSVMPAVVGGHMGLGAIAPAGTSSGQAEGIRYPSHHGAVETTN